MNKDLNKEYSEMIRSDLPDLWDRISENLPEKERKPEKSKIYRFAVVAAACVCVAILIPVITMNTRMGRSAEQVAFSTATAQDVSDQKTMAAAAAEEAAPEEASYDEGVPEIMAAGAYEEVSAKEAAPEVMADEAYEEASAKETVTGEQPVLIYNVSVDIRAIHEKVEDRQILEAVILTGGDNGELQAGEEILLAIDSLTPPELVEELSLGIAEFDLEESESQDETLYLIR